jgi:hypothetical protein
VTIPATTAGLKQIQDLTNLAKEFNFYAKGTKQIADAKAFKSQFAALKNGISATKKTADTASTIAKKAEGITSLLQKGLFKQINPAWGARLNVYLTLANMGVSALIVKKNEEIQELNIQSQKVTEAGLADTFTRTINNSIQIKTLQN